MIFARVTTRGHSILIVTPDWMPSKKRSNMHLSSQLISEFRGTYRDKFGEDISEGEARRDLSELANIVKILIGGRKVNNE